MTVFVERKKNKQPYTHKRAYKKYNPQRGSLNDFLNAHEFAIKCLLLFVRVY